MTRPDNAEDCDVCGGSGRYGIVTANGKWWGTIECPECCGCGHDFGEAAELAAERAQEAADNAIRAKYEYHMAEQRKANG